MSPRTRSFGWYLQAFLSLCAGLFVIALTRNLWGGIAGGMMILGGAILGAMAFLSSRGRKESRR